MGVIAWGTAVVVLKDLCEDGGEARFSITRWVSEEEKSGGLGLGLGLENEI